MATFGERTRALMDERGISLRELARRTHYDHSHLSRLVNGRKAPSSTVAAVLDDALDAGGELTALLPVLPADDLDRISSAVDEPRRADMATVAAFENLFDATTQVPETRPADLITTMTPVYELIQRFRHDAPSEVRYGLLSICSRTAQLISWMEYESGKLDAATTWSDRALNAALAAGNDELVAYTLARRSSYTRAERDPAQGVDLAVAAQQYTTLSPPVAHMALRHEAQGWALLGDAAACQDRLSRSVDALTRSDGGREPAYAAGFSMAYLDVQRAGCLVELGRHADAIDIYERNANVITPGYVRAVNLARLARAYVDAGEHDQAAEIGRDALALARRTGAARAVVELRRVPSDTARWWD